MSILDAFTVEDLKAQYLYGVNFQRDDGEPFPDELFEHSIDAAVSQVATDIGIVLDDVHAFEERFDTGPYDGDSWYRLALTNRPVVEVTAVGLHIADFKEQVLPLSWVHLRDAILGTVQLIPGAEAFSGLSLAGTTMILPTSMANMRRYTPGFIHYHYRAGIDWSTATAKRDHALLLRAVGLQASMLALDTAGDLIAGAGVANYSISMDSLSQSIGTTSSATNSGYGARLLTYIKEYKMVEKSLKAKYRNRGMFAF